MLTFQSFQRHLSPQQGPRLREIDRRAQHANAEVFRFKNRRSREDYGALHGSSQRPPVACPARIRHGVFATVRKSKMLSALLTREKRQIVSGQRKDILV